MTKVCYRWGGVGKLCLTCNTLFYVCIFGWSSMRCRMVRDLNGRSYVVYRLSGCVCIVVRSDGSGRTALRDYGRSGIGCQTVRDLPELSRVRSGLSDRVVYYLGAVCTSGQSNKRCWKVHKVPIRYEVVLGLSGHTQKRMRMAHRWWWYYTATLMTRR